MKNLPHISSMLYCTPWCIIPSEHAALSGLYQRYLKGEFAETTATPMTPTNLHGAKILWLKLVVSRAIVKKYDELRVFVGYLSDTRSERPIQHIIKNNT